MDKVNVSKSRFAKIIMPKVADVVGDGYRINYVSLSRFFFTVLNPGHKINMGDMVEYNGALFKATSMNFETNKVSFEFVGFKENEAPKQSGEAAKVLDI